MRTTVDVDDSVLAAARALAKDARISVGAALSELARRGLSATTVRREHGFPVFACAPSAPPITLEMVNEHRDGG